MVAATRVRPRGLAVAALLSSPDMHSAAARQGESRAPPSRRRHYRRPGTRGSRGTRLLVIAPHPDDEVLGAGGLMQRVKPPAARARRVPDRRRRLSRRRQGRARRGADREDFLGYGKPRRREARAALVRLGLAEAFQTFLGFPDGGLCRLTRAYWSEHRAAYRSPYTRLNRPPRSEMLVAATQYSGEDLSQELALIIADFRPTMIAVPRREDQHADHCAAWFFLDDSLNDVQRVHPDFTTDVLN